MTAAAAAELYWDWMTANKWAFMDAVLELVNSNQDSSQSAVVESIGDTATFIAMHGDHRDPVNGAKARSRLKSIKDELTVVKTWPRADRVPGVSFEMHKLVNTLGAVDGGTLLRDLALELGGGANVTKSAVKARLSAPGTERGPRGASVGSDPVEPGRLVGELPIDITGNESIDEHVAEDVGEHELPGDQLIGNEARLAFGSEVSVSNQEHYQEALSRLRGSRLEFPTSTADDIELYGTEVYRDPSGFEVAVFVATLVINDEGNPWVKKKTGPILEIRVGSDTVGFLTPAMTERYIGFARSAAKQGRPLTAFAVVEDGSGKRGRDVEITLQAMPMWHGQRDITGLQVRTTPEYAVLLSTGRTHRIVAEQDGWWETKCGRKLPDAEVDVVYRTKPWVGRVLRDGSITDHAALWCGECKGSAAQILE
jgi:hypothetical protein